jgi:hypothetical protein
LRSAAVGVKKESGSGSEILMRESYNKKKIKRNVRKFVVFRAGGLNTLNEGCGPFHVTSCAFSAEISISFSLSTLEIPAVVLSAMFTLMRWKVHDTTNERPFINTKQGRAYACAAILDYSLRDRRKMSANQLYRYDM